MKGCHLAHELPVPAALELLSLSLTFSSSFAGFADPFDSFDLATSFDRVPLLATDLPVALSSWVVSEVTWLLSCAFSASKAATFSDGMGKSIADELTLMPDVCCVLFIEWERIEP